MTTSSSSRLGLVALAAAGVLDGVQLIPLLITNDAPVFVAVATAVFGILTLAGVAAAWGGSRAGLLTVIAVRIADALILGLPGFFLDAPWYALAIAVGCAVLSVAGIWLSAPALRRVRPSVA